MTSIRRSRVAELQALAREINTAKAGGNIDKAAGLGAELRALGARLGLLELDPEVFLRKRAARQIGTVVVGGPAELQGAVTSTVTTPAEVRALTDADIDRLIDERAAARTAKDFKASDRIRAELAASGVLLEDMPGGKTLWRRG